MSDTQEKRGVSPSINGSPSPGRDLEAKEAFQGYVLDPSRYPNGAADFKTTDDGRYVLIPQPQNTPDDPLNWSPRKKLLILTIIGYIAALADYVGGTAIITVIPQSMQWQMTQMATQRAVVGNIFCIGACGLIVVALAGYFGRLPVTIVFQAIFLGTTCWSAAATNFDSYLAARVLNGLTCSVGQGGALMWIKDLFYFHEHPRAINYVEFWIILSPYLGPLVAAFVVSDISWPWAFWICSILAGVSLILAFFLDETLYDRSIPLPQQTPRGPYFKRILGVEQAKSWKYRSMSECFARPLVALTKLPVLMIVVYYFLNFAWVIGVNTTISLWLTDYYGFSLRGIGYFYFFGIVGCITGWLAGHWLHDAIGKAYARRHAGHIDPEARLLIAYPATAILTISLIILGLAFEYQWHYMVIAVFATTQCFGVMLVTTAINAYLLDSYPEGSGEVGAWITASRNWSGFMATYIQIEWVTNIGPARALGAQAGITAFSIIFIVLLQLYGKRLRIRHGRMVFKSSKVK